MFTPFVIDEYLYLFGSVVEIDKRHVIYRFPQLLAASG